MAIYDAKQNFDVRIKETKLRTYNKDGDLRVDRVVLKTEDERIPKGKITVNPEVDDVERTTKVVNGKEYNTETEESRDPTIREFANEFDKLDQIIQAVRDYGAVDLNGLVRTVRDDDAPEDENNFFIRISELDEFTATAVSEETHEPVEESAEEYAEDVEDLDEDEDSEELEAGDQIL